MAKEPEHSHEPWTQAQEKQLEQLAKGNMPTGARSSTACLSTRHSSCYNT